MKKSVKLTITLLLFISVLFNGNIVKALDETTLFSNGGTTVYYGATDPKSMEFNESKVTLSGSSLVKMPYLFCCQHGSDINGIYDYDVRGPINDYNTAKAYILSNKKFPDIKINATWEEDENTGHIRGHSRAQKAFWCLNGGSIGYSYSELDADSQDLYNKAQAFKIYRTNVSNNGGLITKVNTTIVYKPEYHTIGPLKVNYVVTGSYNSKKYDFGAINSFTIKGIKNGTETNLNATDYVFTSDKEGKETITTIKSNDNFYIKLKNTNITKVISMNINISGQKAYANYYLLTYKGKQETCFVKDAKVIKYYESANFDINKTLIPKLNITLNKINQKKATLSGATFTTKFKQDGNDLTATNNTVQPTSTNPVTVTITEDTAPTGYKKLVGDIVVEFTYDNTSAKWVGKITNAPELEKSGISVTTSGTGTTIATVTVTDLAKIDSNKFKISKVSTTGENIKGAVFDVSIISGNGYFDTKGNGTMLMNCTSTDEGSIALKPIVVTDLNKDIVLKFEETYTPKGYKKLDEPIIVTISYDGVNKWAAKCDSTSSVITQDISGDGTVANDDAELLLNYSTGTLENNTYGIGNKIVLGDVNNDGVVNSADALLVQKYAVGQGTLITRQLLAADANGDGIIKNADAELILKYSTGTLENNTYGIGKQTGKIFGDLDNDGIVNSADAQIILSYIVNNKNSKLTATASGDTITLAIPNIPIMLVGGMVFNDIDVGENKNNTKRAQNNQFDEGEGLAGVKVDLLDSDDNIVATTHSSEGETVKYTSYTGEEKEKTLAKGEYFFSKANDKDYLELDNYKVQFTYNGQKFTTTAKAQDLYSIAPRESKVDEQGRTEFNQKFATISEGTASTGGSISYMSTQKQNVEGVNDANLIMYKGDYSWDAKGNNTEAVVLDLYQIKAKTPNANGFDMTKNWLNVWNDNGTANDKAFQLNINCGLRERKLDLSLIADVNNTEVKINGKSTTYNYAQTLDGNLNNLGEKKSDDVAKKYNQMIYESDYNFRLADYEKGLIPADREKLNADNIVDLKNSSSELEIYVKYALKIKCQTMTENGTITVNEVKDYYDTNTYTYVSSENATVTGENGELTISNLGTLSKTGNDSVTVYLTFKIIIPENKEAGEVLCTGTNKAEITKYTTGDGLIDRDSAPGNANLNSENENYEDDTDLANGIEYSLAKKDTTRTISGYVWDDSAKTEKYEIGDGKFDCETKVNDVLVQLIELKTIELNGSKYTLEYIWQETRSGSNEVFGINLANTEISTYNNKIQAKKDDADTGEYKFTGFIPGDYIVRFIYGDGRTYDIDSNSRKKIADKDVSLSVKQYNGQDYKSTKYTDYANTEYYNQATNSYDQDISVARDNEARRLEVMAYSTTIDNTIGTDIANQTAEMLNDTWMCAETLKINVPVDASDLATNSPTTTTDGSSSGTGNTFNKINFGLELRPKTKLVLEKHITGLKITPNASGATDLLDAKVDIDDVLDGTIDTKTGVTKGLSTIVSERQNRGFWKLETDLEELAQGANVEVTYTYVVKNKGDEDYLSSTLVGAYKYFLDCNTAIDKYLNQTTYNSYLTKIGEIVKGQIKTNSNTIGEYLGKYYYSGLDKDKDTLVPTRAEEIEEALNNKLSLDDSTLSTINKDFTKVTDDDETSSAYVNTLTTVNNYERNVWRNNGRDITIVQEKMNTIVKSNSPTEPLNPTNNDTNKTLTLNTTLSSVTADSAQLTFDSYIAEITKYTNAAGRANMKAVPENLSYVHSDDNQRTLDTVPGYYINEKSNEDDEFWGETVIISKPTGQDKLTPIQIVAITTAAVAIVGVGIVLIKKYVIK